jgi:hypothetical protein
MPGLRSDEEILRAFDGLDYIPGSKKKRIEDNPKAQTRRKQAAGDFDNGWADNPIIKTMFGRETEVYTISALAQALDKKIVTIRLWEKKGYIPMAPYRLRKKVINGKEVMGNRVYTKDLIEIAIDEFARRGLLGSARVEWNHHQELTDAIVKRWRESVANESRKTSD